MKKKAFIIVCSVLAVCILGLLLSRYLSWPVSSERASGDVSKAARFSRAPQFGALVDMSNEVAGDIPAFAGVLEEMNAINAALDSTTLQKKNKLADRFIETTDKYLETVEGDDRLKFVRDQWVDYKKMTAALEGDS
jgi:hypothetical protein